MSDGHFRVGPVIVYYGDNAMHWAINIRTRWGFLCAHPTVRCWPWYIYLSPDATPDRATWGIGGKGWR